MTRAPMAAGATCFVLIVMVLSALLFAPSRLGAQVLRNPETPYHFLRYDDVPSDQDSPYWPTGVEGYLLSKTESVVVDGLCY